MIVEDERDTYTHHGYEIPNYDCVGSVEGVNVQVDTKEAVNDEGGGESTQGDNSDWKYSTQRPKIMKMYLRNKIQVCNREPHHKLKEDLKKHIW